MKYEIASMSIAGCIPSTTNPLDNKYNVQRIQSAKYHVPYHDQLLLGGG